MRVYECVYVWLFEKLMGSYDMCETDEGELLRTVECNKHFVCVYNKHNFNLFQHK